MNTQSNISGFLDAYKASNLASVEPEIKTTLNNIVENINIAKSQLGQFQSESVRSNIEKLLISATAQQENKEQQLKEIGLIFESLLNDLLKNKTEDLKQVQISVKKSIFQYLLIAQKLDSLSVKNIGISLGKRLSQERG